ncbi:hypothetical protein [Mycoplasma sp. P36-A1]|uniref:hypothetical protein n=1 Tax=Mycoplasma sp. P36-A1 TaxID=3252900 RepID=UPI003C2C744D
MKEKIDIHKMKTELIDELISKDISIINDYKSYSLSEAKDKLWHLIDSKGTNPNAVGNEIGINKAIYKATNSFNESKVSRDRLLAILIHIGCDIEQVNDMLVVFKYNKLYSKIVKDALIMNCILNKKTLIEINQYLHNNGENALISE